MKDTVVLITGATRGLGREVARQLAERGATVLSAPATRPRLTRRQPSSAGPAIVRSLRGRSGPADDPRVLLTLSRGRRARRHATFNSGHPWEPPRLDVVGGSLTYPGVAVSDARLSLNI